MPLSEPEREAGGGSNVVDTFRRLYFHLYGNANTSRAERIASDLCMLLLLKAVFDQGGRSGVVERYLAGELDADAALTPIVRERYPALAGQWPGFSLDAQALHWAARRLLRLDLSQAPAHVIGDAFQALMGPRLRGDRGQFFTPRTLVRAMVDIVAPSGSETVLDPACGTGGFLAEAYGYMQRHGAEPGRLVGRDKDADMVGLSTALLELMAPRCADVKHSNALDLQTWGDEPGVRPGTVDVVLTNPPFGSKIGIRDPGILGQYDLGRTWRKHRGRWCMEAALVQARDPQTLFVELAIRMLKPGGRLAIVLPEGLFGNQRHGYLWAWLRGQGHLEALLDCPRTTFQPGTDIKTNVLVFIKTAAERRRRVTKVAVAQHCGHDRRGRTTGSDGVAHRDDLQPLGRAYHGAAARNGWASVDLSRQDYLVPRYHVPVTPASERERELLAGAPTSTLRALVQQGTVKIRKGHEVGERAYGTGDIPFVRTSDLANMEIRSDPTKSVSEEVYRAHREQQQLSPGNILLVADGRYRIGTMAILNESDLPCVVQSHLRIIESCDEDVVDPYELLYALSLASVQRRIQSLVFVQSTLGTLGPRLLDLRVPLLHGEGPWRARIDRFKDVLQQRARLLQQLEELP